MEIQNGFSYRYHAGDQAEEDALRRRYHLPANAEISSDLRGAPSGERKAALRFSLLAGACGLLVFGSGLYVILVSSSVWVFSAGVILALAGMAGLLSIPWVYRRTAERKRQQNEKTYAGFYSSESSSVS